MQISVNDELKSLEKPLSLVELMQQLGFEERKGFAVAVNGEVVRKTQWGSCLIKENDSIILITATQGG